MSRFVGQLRTLVWKELLIEARARETVLAGGVFALLVLVVFNFAFDLRVENVAAVAPGVLWVTVTFAGVLSLGRSFARLLVAQGATKVYAADPGHTLDALFDDLVRQVRQIACGHLARE